jgi:hypothetical protein
MKISLPTRTALGDPTQFWPPDPAADFTITALAGSGGAIGTRPKGAVAAGAVSSSCVTYQQYAMRHKSNATCILRRETKIVVLVVLVVLVVIVVIVVISAISLFAFSAAGARQGS